MLQHWHYQPVTAWSDDVILLTLSYSAAPEHPAYMDTVGVDQMHFQLCHRLLVRKCLAATVDPMQCSFVTLIMAEKYTGRKRFERNCYYHMLISIWNQYIFIFMNIKLCYLIIFLVVVWRKVLFLLSTSFILHLISHTKLDFKLSLKKHICFLTNKKRTSVQKKKKKSAMENQKYGIVI